jgi:D-Tyr-tRNAtyr deacylase
MNLNEVLKEWWDNVGSGLRPALNKAGKLEDNEEFMERVLNRYNEHLKEVGTGDLGMDAGMKHPSQR